MSRTTRTSLTAALTALAGLANAQIPATVPFGVNMQSWNPATAVQGLNDWSPERPNAIGFGDGLRWEWQETDTEGLPISPRLVRVCDPAVPGIEAAYQFPAARASTSTPGIPESNRGENWQNIATPDTRATFEIWFKPADLTGSHVLLEIGGLNRGIAFALEDDELVYAAAGSNAGGSSYSVVHRETLTDTEWHQAVVVVDFFAFNVRSYLDGAEVNSQSIPVNGGYRWSNSNQAGLGQQGGDPAENPGIATGAIPAANFTLFDGMISTHRFYATALTAAEVMDNYEAITDADATARRGDFNRDGIVTTADIVDLVNALDATTNDSLDGAHLPFVAAPGGGIFSVDPARNETFTNSFAWDMDRGSLGAGANPSFIFNVADFLTPVKVTDPAFPTIREAFVLDGSEGFGGPNLEFAEDAGNSLRVQLWLNFSDVTGNHCLFEAGGTATGFSVVSMGSQLMAGINTSANDGLDIASIATDPGVLTPGWHLVEVIVRRITGDGVGEGFEVYLDGERVANINDLPGPDLVFGTADDIDMFNSGGSGTFNFINGNPSGLGQLQGTAALPAGVTAGQLVPFNGLVGPVRILAGQPTPAMVAVQFDTDMGQTAYNTRFDFDASGAVDAFDLLDQLCAINAGL